MCVYCKHTYPALSAVKSNAEAVLLLHRLLLLLLLFCYTGTEISWVTQSQQASDHQQQQPQQQQQQQNSLHPQQQPQQQQQQLQQRQQAWGSAISLYELDPLTGQRNGDPIADCFASITYLQGAVLALADGVNWGEKPKQAARGAVLGFCSSLHRQLAYAQGVGCCDRTDTCTCTHSPWSTHS